MTQRHINEFSRWPSLNLEGGLIAPAMLVKIGAYEASEQSPEDYAVRKGLTLRDEISTAFHVGQSHHESYINFQTASIENAVRSIGDLLFDTFGLNTVDVTDEMNLFAKSQRIPIMIISPNSSLDQRIREGNGNRPKSSSFALQDHLNDSNEFLWGLITNGYHLRIMRKNSSLTRFEYIEFDLDGIFKNTDISSFSLLWALIHYTRFQKNKDTPTDCIIERWRKSGFKEGEAARERLADQVRDALGILGSGFLKSNPHLSNKLKSGDIDLTSWFNEVLRLVYRIVFLMVSEDRDLLHPNSAGKECRQLYKDGYSIANLRQKCTRGSSRNNYYDLYEGLKIVFKSLSKGQTLIGIPAFGGMFKEEHLSNIIHLKLKNRYLMEVIYKLSWLSSKPNMVSINWRAMETEELGSVYESLLDLQPLLGNDGTTISFASDRLGSQRKTTGSYYTPHKLVQALLDTSLDPLVRKIETESSSPESDLLKLSIIDPACGSGHFILAASRRVAVSLARVRANGTPSPSQRRSALRDVVRNCIFGVDKNSMAVELTKVALWIETVNPEYPLGFLDAQIRCGDALLGVFDGNSVLEFGVPDEAYESLIGDSREVSRYYRRVNRDAKAGQGELDLSTGRTVMPAEKVLASRFLDLHNMPEDTVDQVDSKATRHSELENQRNSSNEKRAFDLYILSFLLPKSGPVPDGVTDRSIPTTADVWAAHRTGEVSASITEVLDTVSHEKVFHWWLEFPHIVQNDGFDVVIGNPPWERVELQESEFFSTARPDIAMSPTAKRKPMIEKLKTSDDISDKKLYSDYLYSKRLAEATSSFVHIARDKGGRFPYTGRGKVNTYALFAELFVNLVSDCGRCGIIVPTGIATDSTTAPFFNWLIKNGWLESLFDFGNRKKLFPAVHSLTKFSLVTLSGKNSSIDFSFSLTDPSQVSDLDRRYVLDLEQIEKINPNTRTAPIFRSKADGGLVGKIYDNVPVFINEAEGRMGNPWVASFMAMFNMATDADMLHTRFELEEDGYIRHQLNYVKCDKVFVPLHEAKMIYQYNHRFADALSLISRPKSSPWPKSEKHQLCDPSYEVTPWYWVSDANFKTRISKIRDKNYWVVFRSISNASNERTVIASALYSTALSLKLPAIVTAQEPEMDAALLGALNSLVVDYVARLKVGGTDLAFHYVRQLPILPPSYFDEARLSFIVPRVLQLSYSSYSMKSFAESLNHHGRPFVWDCDRISILKAELDAFYVRAYGLNRNDLLYILDPTNVMKNDYPSETFRGLKRNEIRDFGEFRTQRLVLAAWDRMESSGEFAKMDM